jgi:hypothetical protein
MAKTYLPFWQGIVSSPVQVGLYFLGRSKELIQEITLGAEVDTTSVGRFFRIKECETIMVFLEVYESIQY